jgi:hypothetical protein
MKLLGACLISTIEQRAMKSGATLDLPRERLMPKMLAVARIGDVMWAQEPWALVTSRRFGPQNIREAIVGPVVGDRIVPGHIKHILHELRQRRMPAAALAKADSRACLEIMGITEHSVRVLVHMTHVRAFLKGRAGCKSSVV